ncbi:cytidine deaminase [Hydrogenispora ethanolica]|jgi:cytidine deaminase|uniref:Cytidine deaminase n=1 Tax=Hydrogenispora ethanolica TaxID=1082276 RepID=A0A4R1RGZ1_HYDET|nr:cytidine deaminase [Hydrogenispora ethanolica]TCL65291.1 cytidine deaminase [Hydrogenispora ethanolica]
MENQKIREQLIAAATAARERAYAPYSHYKVGAALLGRSGTVYTGCNIENAAYSAGICAERVAASKAVSEGEKDFAALAVVVEGAEPGSPCGVCRQFLAEFDLDLPLYLANLSGAVVETTLREYLPQAFGPAHLKSRRNE